MKSCCKCGKSLLSGYILCSECKEVNSLPLRYYIDQLAEDIVLEHPNRCSFCIRGSCDNQQSGLTCRYGVKEFLVGKIKPYSDNLEASLVMYKDHYALLDGLNSENCISDAENRLEEAFPGLSEYNAHAILSTWKDIRSFDEKKGN